MMALVLIDLKTKFIVTVLWQILTSIHLNILSFYENYYFQVVARSQKIGEKRL